MKPFKLGLRIWIGVISTLTFLSGWFVFSHSQKPAPLPGFTSSGSTQASAIAIPTLVPATSSNSVSLSSLFQPLTSSSSSSSQTSSSVMLRARGS